MRATLFTIPLYIQLITDLRDHGVIVDADVTSLLDAAVYTDLTAEQTRKGSYWQDIWQSLKDTERIVC